jgi:hypothetical protein
MGLALGISGVCTVANATCFGSNSFQSCNDNSGNSYTVQRFGNQTMMNGYNGNTGSMWSQNSMTFGNTTLHNGFTNGNPWNMTDQRMGTMRSIYGTDSRGNSFNYLCTQFGCDPKMSAAKPLPDIRSGWTVTKDGEEVCSDPDVDADAKEIECE